MPSTKDVSLMNRDPAEWFKQHSYDYRQFPNLGGSIDTDRRIPRPRHKTGSAARLGVGYFAGSEALGKSERSERCPTRR